MLDLADPNTPATSPVCQRLPSSLKPASATVRARAAVESEIWVEIIRDIDGLALHRAAWDELAATAVERNPFYESWMLLSGAKHFGANSDLRFYLVWKRNPRQNQPPALIGFFPLELRRGFGGLPVRYLKVWQHQYLYYCSPLVRSGVAREVLHALLDDISYGDRRGTMLEFHHIDRGGPFAQALLDVTNERASATFTADAYNRALFRPAANYEAYIAAAMTNHNRQEIRRQGRRLSEQGHLEVRVLSPEDSLDEWLDHFLKLEAAGWKGQERTALACDQSSRAYFETIARGAFARGQLMMLGLFLDQQPIAVKCNFLAGGGSYAFKIAFDEKLARFSPGVQLELENIRALHAMSGMEWMDSCATRQHFMIGRLWHGQRTIEKILVSTGRWSDNLTVDVIAALSSIRRMCRRSPLNSISKP
jgi:CelD/BcsL family acetyltransferase involved in cellulose biosynthesis